MNKNRKLDWLVKLTVNVKTSVDDNSFSGTINED